MATIKTIKQKIYSCFASDSRHQIIISISSLAGSGLVSLAIRFIGSIIQGHFVGPEILGYYTKFTILPNYLFFLHMGVFTSLARQYPYYIGKKDKSTAIKYASNALGWTYLLCIVHTVIFFIPCMLAAKEGDWRASLGWGVQVIITNTSLYMFYLGCTYRNSSEFVTWSKAQIISAISSLFFLPLVAIYQFAGICIRYSLPNALSMLFAHLKRPLKIEAKFNQMILKKMMAYGLPLMIFAYISTSLWTAVERSYILKIHGEAALGVFAFAVTLCAGLMAISTSISQVFNPRIAMLYGASNGNMATSFKYCIKCSFFGMIIMLPLIMIAFYIIDPLVKWLLPKYIASIPIAQCLFWLSLIPVMDLPQQLLMVAKQTKKISIAVSISFISFLTAMTLCLQKNISLSLHNFVIISILCKFLCLSICILFAWFEAKNTT